MTLRSSRNAPLQPDTGRNWAFTPNEQYERLRFVGEALSRSAYK